MPIAARTATAAEEYSTVDLDQVRVGAPLFAPVFDVRDVLLLAEGQMVTPSTLQRLRDRDIRFVRAHGRDVIDAAARAAPIPTTFGPLGTAIAAMPDRDGYVTPYRNEASDRLDSEISLRRLQMPQQGEPLLANINRPVGAYDPEARVRALESYNETTAKLCTVYQKLAAGEELDRQSLEEIAERTLLELAGDIDLFSCVGCNPKDNEYPVRHSVNTAMLALSVGVRLEFDVPTLRELVIGCLIHDAGMLWIDPKIYKHPQKLDAVSYLEITKHPILVFDVLKDSGLIPKRSAFIAYQMHERCDGSGYPRRRTAEQIHFLSRVAAVADTYVALVSPRPHRPGMMPYYAMEKILRDVNRGLYDNGAVRGLLRTLSLFPIGSYVELNDGRRARVLRAGVDYCRPMIEIASDSGAGEIIDLAEAQDISVVRALPSLTATATNPVARVG